ncbi:hypothetical protein KDAU_02710 [Dictyobacter aurantiacus]|uniref:Uncharacterized protein n=1 Tax=Dictyobacter aurantiacus TaxID=1936993 RepID=A0A401Z7X1_9CHLR|nr:hypothetical protein KDAU_02710 [Dictyobacter aurantiacus]
MKLTESVPHRTLFGDEGFVAYEAALAWVTGEIAVSPIAKLNARAKRQ